MSQRISPIKPDFSMLNQSQALFRAAAATARAHVTRRGAEFECKTLFERDFAALATVKAATSPATLTDPNWAAPLGRNVVSDAVAEMITLSAAADLIARGLKIDLTGLASVAVPGRIVSATQGGAWCAEGSPIPVRGGSMTTAGCTLEPHKLAVIVALTREIAASSNVEAVVTALLNESTALALDAGIFSANPATPAQPAGILNGVAPLVPTAGGSENALVGDIRVLAEALTAAGGGRNTVYVVDLGSRLYLESHVGPHFSVPVLTANIAPRTIIAVEASSFVSGFDGVAEMSTSTAGVLHFEDVAPADIVDGIGTIATPVRSMWQHDSFALRMILRASWGMRAPEHAQYITGVTW